jgi:hypothetical protein
MKAKTIKAILTKKINEWIATVEDQPLRELLNKNVIVTGGAIASMLLKETVSDYDIYFRDYDTTKRVAEYYVKRFEVKNHKGIACKIHVDDQMPGRVRIIIKSAGIASAEGSDKPYEYFESAPERSAGYVGEIMTDPGDIQEAYDEAERAALSTGNDDTAEDKKYRPIFMSTNAITLSGRVQLILRFFGEPDQIHENYDFVHCTNYWTKRDGALVLRPAALESLLARELRYVGSKYPICSLIRLRKFIRRNWTINAGQILKMVMQISELDLKDVNVLEDQLTGVDVAYFIELINKLKEKDPDKVNSAYLVEIIDRMF